GVRGNELPFIGDGANDIDLILLIAAPGIADETHPTQQEPGIAVAGLDWNLAPVAVPLAPILSGPSRVQAIECSVAGLHPVLKFLLRIRVKRLLSILIIDLPTDDVWIVSEALGQLRGDLAAHFAILCVRPIELLAIAVLIFRAILLGAKRLGIFLREPGRGCRGWSANHSVDSPLTCCVNCMLEPVEFVLSFRGLHSRPGKFADAH